MGRKTELALSDKKRDILEKNEVRLWKRKRKGKKIMAIASSL